MSRSQCAYVDPGGGRVTTRWAATQRSEPPQPRLLNQTLIFFNYFESIEFGWIRATITPPKVCQVVNAHRLIRAGEGLLLGGPVNQRTEPPQPRLLGQTLRFFHYFWRFELTWIRARIMPPKACGVVSAQEFIRAGGRWWQLGDRAAKPVNIPDRICAVKPASFSMILTALKSPRPARQFLS